MLVADDSLVRKEPLYRRRALLFPRCSVIIASHGLSAFLSVNRVFDGHATTRGGGSAIAHSDLKKLASDDRLSCPAVGQIIDHGTPRSRFSTYSEVPSPGCSKDNRRYQPVQKTTRALRWAKAHELCVKQNLINRLLLNYYSSETLLNAGLQPYQFQLESVRGETRAVRASLATKREWTGLSKRLGRRPPK